MEAWAATFFFTFSVVPSSRAKSGKLLVPDCNHRWGYRRQVLRVYCSFSNSFHGNVHYNSSRHLFTNWKAETDHYPKSSQSKLITIIIQSKLTEVNIFDHHDQGKKYFHNNNIFLSSILFIVSENSFAYHVYQKYDTISYIKNHYEIMCICHLKISNNRIKV